MMVMPKRSSTERAACWYRLLTADQNIGTDPSIRFAVTSRVLLSKQHKINKQLVMVRNNKWNTRSFI
jgi:hypothetical protein